MNQTERVAAAEANGRLLLATGLADLDFERWERELERALTPRWVRVVSAIFRWIP